MAGSSRTHTRIAGAPDYDSPEFWDVRFATGQDVGEWLNSGETLLETALSELESRHGFHGGSPRVLHLGPGVSQLGFKLRDAYLERSWSGNAIVVSSLFMLFDAPLQALPTHCCQFQQNVDFSAEAVRLGQNAESHRKPDQAMHWQRADLLAWDHVSTLARFAPFDVILDKSTSDAIATSSDQKYTSTDDMSHVCPIVRDYLSTQPTVTLSPVESLALHLVPLTQKNTTWVTLSYSTLRFDNLPFLKRYWTLRSRTPLKAPPGPVSSSAHAPEVFHWIYIMDRN